MVSIKKEKKHLLNKNFQSKVTSIIWRFLATVPTLCTSQHKADTFLQIILFWTSGGITKHLMTGPTGNRGSCFLLILNVALSGTLWGNKMGDSRKYPYHTTDGFSEFRGQGGFFELEFRRHGGILTSGILKAWGGVRSGIYTGDRQEFIPWKLFISTF